MKNNGFEKKRVMKDIQARFFSRLLGSKVLIMFSRG